VIIVDGAAHSGERGVESNGGSLKDGAEAFYAVPARRSAGFAVECPHSNLSSMRNAVEEC
jgi:hypothetical protein